MLYHVISAAGFAALLSTKLPGFADPNFEDPLIFQNSSTLPLVPAEIRDA